MPLSPKSPANKTVRASSVLPRALFGVVAVLGPALGGWIVQNYGFKSMLLVAGIIYIAATIIRVSMARAGRHEPALRADPLTFAGLKTNLGTMFGMLFAGGVITWILITDGVRDISFAISFNFFGVFMEQVGGLNIQHRLDNGIFGLLMMVHDPRWLALRQGR